MYLYDNVFEIHFAIGANPAICGNKCKQQTFDPACLKSFTNCNFSY